MTPPSENPEDRQIQGDIDIPEGLSADDLKELQNAQGAMAFLANVKQDIARLEEQQSGHNQPASDPRLSTVAGKQLSTLAEHLTTDEDILQSDSFGRFEIIESVGQGGFAKVFRARDPSLNREVALKIPKPQCLSSEESQVRFRREAQAAAILSHPAIVPVYETGTVGPINYIASEYCDGENLSTWFASQNSRIQIRTAVELMARLADAVHHAHQRGVVHRDLKPANILVEDGEQSIADRIRITDFGLAKQLDSDDATLTVEGAVVGTPAYMSPEQARGSDQVAAPSDLFSLGVIMYELLTGKLAFLKSNHLSTLRAIEEEVPEAPGRLNAEIPKDVSAICLKCLNKDPKDRYENAYALATDLNAWLNGHAVKARHATVMEQFTRWAKRNPALATVGSLAIAFFAIGLAGTTWQWREAQNNLQLSQEEFKRAEENLEKANIAILQEQTQRERAEKVLRYFGLIFNSSSPGENREVKVVDVLTQAQSDIPDLFKDDPESLDMMMQQLGAAYFNLGLMDEVLEILVPLYEQRKSNQVPTNQDTVQVARQVAEAYHLKGDADKALEIIDETLLDAKEALGDSAETGKVMLLKASVLRSISRTEEGLELVDQALDVLEQFRNQPEFPEKQYLRNQVLRGTFLSALGRKDEAYQALKAAYQTQQLGEDHPVTIRIRSELAVASKGRASKQELVELWEDILSSSERVFGPEHPKTFQVMSNLAGIYNSAKRYDESFALYKKSHEIGLKTLGADSPHPYFPLTYWGSALAKVGRLDEALPKLEKSYAVFRETVGARHSITATALKNLADVYERLERWDDAIEIWGDYIADATAAKAQPISIQMAAARQGAANIYAGDVEQGLKKVDLLIEAIPNSELPEDVKIKALTGHTCRTAAALIATENFDLVTPYLNKFVAQTKSTETPDNYKLLANIFQAAVYANNNQEEQAAEVIKNVVAHDSELSKVMVNPHELIWANAALNKFLSAASKTESELTVHVQRIEQFMGIEN